MSSVSERIHRLLFFQFGSCNDEKKPRSVMFGEFNLACQKKVFDDVVSHILHVSNSYYYKNFYFPSPKNFFDSISD
jgi:hypothetical protein